MEPEEIMRVGKFWEKSWEKGYLESLSPEERLQGLDADLKKIKPTLTLK
jgi:hypothetical protein